MEASFFPPPRWFGITLMIRIFERSAYSVIPWPSFNTSKTLGGIILTPPTSFLLSNVYKPGLFTSPPKYTWTGLYCLIDIKNPYSLCTEKEIRSNQKLSACYTFNGLKKIKVDSLKFTQFCFYLNVYFNSLKFI